MEPERSFSSLKSSLFLQRIRVHSPTPTADSSPPSASSVPWELRPSYGLYKHLHEHGAHTKAHTDTHIKYIKKILKERSHLLCEIYTFSYGNENRWSHIIVKERNNSGILRGSNRLQVSHKEQSQVNNIWPDINLRSSC